MLFLAVTYSSVYKFVLMSYCHLSSYHMLLWLYSM